MESKHTENLVGEQSKQAHLAERLKESLLAHGDMLKRGARPSPKSPASSGIAAGQEHLGTAPGMAVPLGVRPVLGCTVPRGQLEQNRHPTLWVRFHTSKPEHFQSGSHKAA